MKARILIAMLVFSTLLAGCGLNLKDSTRAIHTVNGSGKIASQSWTVSGFDTVSHNGVGDLTITQGDLEALSIDAEDNILPLFIVEVKDRGLRIWLEVDSHTVVKPTQAIVIKLAAKNLKALNLNGSGSISAAQITCR